MCSSIRRARASPITVSMNHDSSQKVCQSWWSRPVEKIWNFLEKRLTDLLSYLTRARYRSRIEERVKVWKSLVKLSLEGSD